MALREQDPRSAAAARAAESPGPIARFRPILGWAAVGAAMLAFQLFDQSPMTEPIFFGGLGLGSIAALSYFRNDRGETFVERSASTLKVVGAKLQLVRFLAIFGGVHVAFLVLYFIPCQWLATHGDAFPDGYPSYMVNHMCNYQGSDPGLQPCPGPGVPIPRP